MGQESFTDQHLCTSCQLRLCGTYSRINAFNLYHFHLHEAVFLKIGLSYRIQQAFASTISLTVMLLNIFNLRIFAYKEAMNTIMLGILVTAVMNTAASNNYNITVITNVEIIIYHFLKSAFAKNYWYMNAFLLGAWLYTDINAAYISLGGNINISSSISLCQITVSTNIICTLRSTMQVSNLHQKSSLDLIYHLSPPLSENLLQEAATALVPRRAGIISSLLPRLDTPPSASTIISSAILRIRS